MTTLSRKEFLKHVEKNVVLIYCKWDKDGKMTFDGHGVLVSTSGMIATASHLFIRMVGKRIVFSKKVGDEVVVELLSGSSVGKFYAKITKLDASRDLALLEVVRSFDGKAKKFRFSYAPLAVEVSIGQIVHMLASSDGVQFEYTDGRIVMTSRLHSEITDPNETKYFSPDTPLIQAQNLHGVPGCSGAPVFDSRGSLIGNYSFGFGRMDFLVHLTILKEVCVQTQDEGEAMVQDEGEASTTRRKGKDKGEASTTRRKGKQAS